MKPGPGISSLVRISIANVPPSIIASVTATKNISAIRL